MTNHRSTFIPPTTTRDPHGFILMFRILGVLLVGAGIVVWAWLA